jgi:tRNA(Arg) A34 adenosine deaminase TadA
VNHAESSLARLAYCHYSKEYLWRCTLVSTWEPCAMCSGELVFEGGMVVGVGEMGVWDMG